MDLQSYSLDALDDPRDVLHRTVQTLVEGGIAILPLENGPAGCQMATVPPPEPDLLPRASLLVGSVERAFDWLPDLTTVQARLVTRSWPGPVVFRVADDDWTLAPVLPRAVRAMVADADGLAIRVSRSAVVDDILALLPAPLIAAEEGRWRERAAIELIDPAAPSLRPATVVRLQSGEGGGYDILREGAVSKAELLGDAGMEIVFVCTGNTCRSPLAEAVLRQAAAQELGLPPERVADAGLTVRSVGLAATDGTPASADSVDVARQHGLDLTGHASTAATLEGIGRADLVFTMTQGHRAAILSQMPELAETVLVLAPDGRDVSDPIGMGPAAYAACFEEIREAIRQRLPAILDELSSGREVV